MKQLLVITLLIFTLGFRTVAAETDGVKSYNNKSDEVLLVNIQEVISKPKLYNGKKVALGGVVKAVKFTTSMKGEPFTVFNLQDSDGNKIGVYYEDQHLSISKGDRVIIMGKFRKEKRYLLYKIKNVIKAKTVDIVKKSP